MTTQDHIEVLTKDFLKRQQAGGRGTDKRITEEMYREHLRNQGPKVIQLLFANRNYEASERGQRETDAMIKKMTDHNGFMTRLAY
jgi:hypothetical protein